MNFALLSLLIPLTTSLLLLLLRSRAGGLVILANTFSLVAATSAWLGAGWLVYPRAWSGGLILSIEIAATLSIAAALTLLVIGDTEELAA